MCDCLYPIPCFTSWALEFSSSSLHYFAVTFLTSWCNCTATIFFVIFLKNILCFLCPLIHNSNNIIINNTKFWPTTFFDYIKYDHIIIWINRYIFFNLLLLVSISLFYWCPKQRFNALHFTNLISHSQSYNLVMIIFLQSLQFLIEV